MFDILNKSSEKIICNIGIIGYNEDEIKKRGLNIENNLSLHCLYIYPNDNHSWLNNLTFQMMFPDDNHQIQCPKFFSLTLTDEKGIRSFLYCLKFSEKYDLSTDINKINEIEIPIVIFIKSDKEDLDSFKQLLNLINYIIINNDLEKNGESNYDKINDYKKIQLLNLFYFIFSLPYCPPHSLIKLELCKEFKNYSPNSIDFYFSSNCEIPCNKNDADINILFLLLDQSIIIKILFSILTEKQIVFRASQTYLLHIIIPSFLKLIFPFKWLHRCITVLPSEKINFLEAPGPFIFGVLSSMITLENLINKFPGKIIVDCDTNEIYGDTHYEPFSPPKENINQIQNKNNKKEKENNEVINIGKVLIQGNNAFNINGSYLFKYDNEINAKKHKFNFDKNKNNIIIDTQKSQLLIDKSIIFIDSNEWKWLRRNIQLVRNPEIFYLDNLSKKKKSNNIYLSGEDEENVVLPNRTFSYNIQNIFLKFILNKLSFTESEFMLEFKNTNLYLNYNEPSKYQNNSGKKIVENILELKNKQRNIGNCFNIEYSIPKFDTDLIINKLDEKLKNDTANKEYEIIKLILDNYIKLTSDDEIINGNFHNNNDFVSENTKGERKSDVKKISRITKLYRRGHERNKTSVLQETFSGNNKFILFGSDNSNKGIFKFYKNKGFLEFISCFEKIMKEEKINISEIIYEKKIYQQIINIILEDENIFKINNNEKTEKNSHYLKKSSKKKENYSEKEKITKSILMPIITENALEEEENENNNRRETVIQNNVEDNFDFTNNIMNNLISDIKEEKNEDIINFSNINDMKTIENNSEEDEIEYKMQYYLFIAKILEIILKRKEILDNLMNEVNKNKKEKITINSLLLKLYRLAFKYSGIKHRDFPYFSYYNFLSRLNLEQLKMLNKDFNDFEKSEIEIFEIYGKVNLEKEKEFQKKQKKSKEKNERINRNKDMNIKKHYRYSQKIDEKEFNKLISINSNNSEYIENNKNESSDFIKTEIYIINSQKEFEININEELEKDLGINLVYNLSKELSELTLIIKDIKVKSSEIILEEMNKYIKNNKIIIKLVGKLKYINIKNINSLKQRMCFWINCFNFLILFTIFYKKWNINSDDEWKSFLRNVKYNIGGDIFSFNDIQYLIYQKVIFFESDFQINDTLKNYRINKSEDAKNIEKKFPLLYNPFMMYLPIKGFNKPIIYEEYQFEIQINKTISDYFLNFLRIDYDKNIHYYELLTEYCPNFFNKEIKKFQTFIIPTIYNFIKDKKYKTAIKKDYEWKLDFGVFLENFN